MKTGARARASASSVEPLRLRRGFQLRCNPERNGKFGPGTVGAQDGHGTSVRLNNCFDEAQPQTQTALRTTLVTTIQSVPDPRLLRRRDPDSIVLNRHLNPVRGRGTADIDVPLFPRVLDGIIKKIRKGLLNTVRIDIRKAGTIHPGGDLDLFFLGNHS